jgi:hypothetical protein
MRWRVMALALALGVAATLSLSLPVKAACTVVPMTYHPAQNAAGSTTGAITRGSTCLHQYRSGTAYAIDSVSIASRPANGALTQAGRFAIRYKPRPGYKGTDQYSLKLCASGARGSGCSVITYRMTIN